ncbi:MAG TPA: hypothetical protein VE985_10970 [Gaiellaceae bacterium]|nr:hypothetical protein [Gaiellaceae bacterium]
MHGRRPLFLVLGGALTFLASLYLPWQGTSHETTASQGVLALLNLFSDNNGSIDGWGSSAGVAASLAALALVGMAAAALVRSDAVRKLPLVPIALALVYLATAHLVVLRADEKLFASHEHFRFSYGAYLGIAAAVVALLASMLGEGRIVRPPSAIEGVGLLLGTGLLVSFLLPWAKPFGPTKLSFPGVKLPLVVLSAGVVCWLLRSAVRNGERFYAAVAIAVLTGAAVDAISPNRVVYGAWMSLGFVLALVASTAFARRPERLVRPSLPVGLTAAAAGTFVVALFLPWQRFCNPAGHPFGHGIGRCIPTTGWAMEEPGAVAGALAIVLILAAVVAAWARAAILELTTGVAILTAAIGTSVAGRPAAVGWGLGYGAYVGFAAAGVLLVIALARRRPPRLERQRLLVRLVPLAASLACFCAIAFPLWSPLPADWDQQASVLIGWYTMGGLLLTLRLVRRWLESAYRPPARADELLLLPLALLALTALDLVRERDSGLTWGGGILVGLCLLLTLFGWIEQRGGLARLEVPELLRVDRLPETES